MTRKSPSSARPSGTSLTQETYEQLRRQLLRCEIQPGSRLNVTELVARLGANSAAVREALSRLTAEGLVLSEPQRGFSAAPVSLEDLLDLTSVRMQIEASCLEQSIAAGGLDWEARVVASHHQLARTSLDASLPSAAWNTAHFEFHRALVSACPSAWSLRLRDMLFEHNARYRALSVAVSGRRRDVASEHVALLEAALARDGERAAQLMREHIHETSKALQQKIAHRLVGDVGAA